MTTSAAKPRPRRMGVGERLDWLIEDYHRQIAEAHARQAEEQRARVDEIDVAMAELDEVAQ